MILLKSSMETEHNQLGPPEPQSRKEIARLIKQLGHWRFARRWAAVESLRKVGPDVIEPLTVVAKSEGRAQVTAAILWGLFLGLSLCLFDMIFHPGKNLS